MNKKLGKKEEEQKKQNILREVLAAKGMNEEEILEVLKDTEVKLTGRTDLDPELKTVKETVVILQKRLGGFWNERKVHRFIKKGDLVPVTFSLPRKYGYQLKMDNIEEFIRLQSKTVDDWKQSYYDLLEKYEDLKYQLEENKDLETVELYEKMQELENKVDELQTKNDHLTEQNRKLLDGYNKDMAERPSKIKYEKTLKEKEETERQLKQLKEENERLINNTKDVTAGTTTEELEQLLKEKSELETTVKENDQTITKQRTENDKKDRKIKRLEKKVKDLEEKTKEMTVE
ncbi:hypothetical protein [Bacillus paranthracis]|uniref:hypothetical protein n=1 Tax=Bacillus paranthracis TaxID=2026186 RepID=UPI0015823FCA|nr:hypothetical protein [Bacillus paranthracis]NUJ08489.1 hypothetical protein [Bacillus paranthracis]